jgi:hypothetical protein
MLSTTLNFICQQLNQIIKPVHRDEKLVELGNIALLDAFQSSVVANLSNHVVVSLINIEEEKTLKNTTTFNTTTKPNGDVSLTKRRTPVFLNLYVLFAANLSVYEQSLDALSGVIGFFQKQNVFDGKDYTELSEVGVERLIFDIYSLRFEELNQVWSVLGGKYIPSVLYRVRLVAIQDSPDILTGVISKTQTEGSLLQN